MGPHRTGGIKSTVAWRTDWSESGLNQIWEKDLGTGFSPATVLDGRVYSMGHVKGQDLIYCFDSESGAEIWTYANESPLFAERHEGGPACALAADTTGIYSLSRVGVAICLDPKTGSEKWKTDLKSVADIKVPLLGFTSSPLLCNDHLVIDVGRVIALRQADGTSAWETEKFVESYSSPGAPFSYESEEHLPLLNGTGLTLVRLRDGHVSWRLPWKTFNYDTNTASPVINEGLAFISSGYDRGCALVRIGAASEEAVVWQKEAFRSRYNTHLLIEDSLFGFDLNEFQCVDFKTGEVKWSEDMGALGCQIRVDDKVILFLEHGELVLVKPGREGYSELGRTHVLGGRCWSLPTFCDGLLYLRNSKGEMVCVSARME